MMKRTHSTFPRMIRTGILFLSMLLLFPLTTAHLTAAPSTASASASAKYKVISGYKEAFNDELQQELSKGWQPVGGVSVTTWNNNLYFAQLLTKSSGQ